jgi:phospholipase A2
MIHANNMSTPEPDMQSLSIDAGDSDKPKGLKGKVHRFYKNVIKPAFPEAIQDVKIKGGMTGLEARVKKEISDPSLFPEVAHVADVRRGIDLCSQENIFLAARKACVRASFARYLGIDPNEVHPDDVPVVAFGGSGGG